MATSCEELTHWKDFDAGRGWGQEEKGTMEKGTLYHLSHQGIPIIDKYVLILICYFILVFWLVWSFSVLFVSFLWLNNFL